MGTASSTWATPRGSNKSHDVDWRRGIGIAAGRRIAEYLVGAALTCAITYVAFQLHFTVPAMASLYLLLVVLAALRWGVWEATTTTVVTFLLLDVFFMEPLFHFTVTKPENWFELAVFEFVGLVVSTLSGRARQHASIADEERNHVTRLYELSRCVLLMDHHQPPGQQITLFVQRTIGVESVALFDSLQARTDWAGSGDPEIHQLARETWVLNQPAGGMEDATWARVLRVGNKAIGAIAMRGRELNPLVVEAIASIAAIALERCRTLENETRVEAVRQSDRLRTAVLDALAHAFKTPLTAIRAASSGLLEAGSLHPPEAELVALIDDESAHLSDLATQLLQTARLEKADVPVRREEFRVASLMEDLLARLPGDFDGHPVTLDIPDPEARIVGNGELIVVALLQLLDNAFKYSTPGSAVTIAVRSDVHGVVISVHNQGPVIGTEEHERIFERFYRAPGTESRAAGTGLGLSITRKVAEAHGGHTWVISDEARGTQFFFSLPASACVPQ